MNKNLSVIPLFIFFLILLPKTSYAECIKGDCVNGKGTFKYKDGSKYVGLFSNGKFHGKGILTSIDTGKYIGEFKDGIYYRTACSCGSDDHEIDLEIEYDKDCQDITLHMYAKVEWSSHWGDMNWFKRIWLRIKAATKIIFTGWIDLQEDFIINKTEHIDTLIEALEEGKKKLLENANEKPL